jgi:hypothetical protein
LYDEAELEASPIYQLYLRLTSLGTSLAASLPDIATAKWAERRATFSAADNVWHHSISTFIGLIITLKDD